MEIVIEIENTHFSTFDPYSLNVRNECRHQPFNFLRRKSLVGLISVTLYLLLFNGF